MENFTNEIIDTKQLPRFEEVQLTSLNTKFWYEIVITSSITLLILGSILGIIWYNSEEFADKGIYFLMLFIVIVLFSFLLKRIGFKKKAYAFRNHDVIYRSGIISTNTMVIPYNRVQHVALHEGFISRYFGLAKVEIFTAGGNSSDIEIPGIEKEEAENIKQLLMGKIQKQL
jgi:membrane protein YdbS with pleckstrin-like domain